MRTDTTMRGTAATMLALGLIPAAAAAQQAPPTARTPAAQMPAAPTAAPAETPPAPPSPAPAQAATAAAPEQQAAPPAQSPSNPRTGTPDNANISDEPDIIVRGQRNLPGSVIGDIPPEQQLGPADIRSYGVSSINDLLTELAPEIRSDRGSGGAPVVLLNGRRISSFNEIRDIPTEAIARVDILPEEVALKYGYDADQRVVNIVLRQRFRALTAEAADRISSRFDRNGPDGELDLLNIRRDRRFNLHSTYQENNPLFEDQRALIAQASPFATAGNVVGADGGALDPSLAGVSETGIPTGGEGSLADFAAAPISPSDLGPYRTLLGSSRTLSVNSSYAKNLAGNTAGTINLRLEGDEGVADEGLPTVSLQVPAGNRFSPFSGPVTVDRAETGYGTLQQRTSSFTGHLGGTLNGQIAKWRWSLTANGDYSVAHTLTDSGVDASAFQARIDADDPTANPFVEPPAGTFTVLPQGFARSRSISGTIDAQAYGTLFSLPAGDVSTSLQVGGATNDFTSSSERLGVVQTGDVSQQSGSGRINVDVPIASKAHGLFGVAGALSLNGNAKVQQLSDFGTLTTYGYGLNWSPVEPVRLIVSVTDTDGAPTPQQLGNPVVVTPNVRVFDYVQGTTATVTTISGGNPGLEGFSTHTAKVGLTLKPWKKHDLTLIANYVTSHVDDPVANFPAATAAIAAAFPGRFTRAADGTLLQVDTRPINFARTSRSELRYGFNVSFALKSDLQKKIEAYRNGTGPNPFAGLQGLQGLRGGNVFGRGGGGQGGYGGYRRPGPYGPAAPAANGQPATGQTTGQTTPGQTTPRQTAPGQAPTQTTPGQTPGQTTPGQTTPDQAAQGMTGQGAADTANPDVVVQGRATPPSGGSPFGGGGFGGRGFGGGGFGGRGFGGGGPDGGGPGGPGGGPGGPGGGGGFGGGRGGFGGRGQQGGGRLQFALYHTWHFTDDVLIAANGPRLDLLNGDAIGSTGGSSRHELEGQAGYSNNGLGLRFSDNFKSATRVNGGTTGDGETLRFGALNTVSGRVFFDPTARLDLIRKHPWLRGTRFTLSVDNIADARQRVTDQTGATPVSYQPNLLDPLGRTVRFSVRKLFF